MAWPGGLKSNLQLKRKKKANKQKDEIDEQTDDKKLTGVQKILAKSKTTSAPKPQKLTGVQKILAKGAKRPDPHGPEVARMAKKGAAIQRRKRAASKKRKKRSANRALANIIKKAPDFALTKKDLDRLIQ